MARILPVILYLSVAWNTLTDADDVSDAPRAGGWMDSKQNQIEFLTRYQYLGERSPDAALRHLSKVRPDRAFEEAVKMFQQRVGLPATGQVDPETKAWMEKPRCGNPDVTTDDVIPSPNDTTTPHRAKRFTVLRGGPWTKHDLTYRIASYPNTHPKLPRRKIREYIEKAFKLWSDISPVTFTPVLSGEDITILFTSGYHGDGYGFDGRSGVLAHTFYPRSQRSGDIHFDDDEIWTFQAPSKGTDLFQVAAHEAGHALGLGHSLDRQAKMYAYYSYDSAYSLHIDDVRGIQALYGEIPDPVTSTSTTTAKPTSTRQPATAPTSTSITTTTATTTATPLAPTTITELPTTTTEPPTTNIFCRRGPIDAITYDEDLNLFAFKDNQVLMLTGGHIQEGYPQTITDTLSIDGPLDAALFIPERREERRTRTCYYNWRGRRFLYWCTRSYVISESAHYIFKNDLVYVFDKDGSMKEALISDVFPRIPSGVDAAFFGTDSHVYFTKGNKFWKTALLTTDDKTLRFETPYEYPKLFTDVTSPFRGLADDSVDAGLLALDRSGDHTNFVFKDDRYYQIIVNVESGLSPSSGNIMEDVFGCNDAVHSSPFALRQRTSHIQALTDRSVSVDKQGHIINSGPHGDIVFSGPNGGSVHLRVSMTSLLGIQVLVTLLIIPSP